MKSISCHVGHLAGNETETCSQGGPWSPDSSHEDPSDAITLSWTTPCGTKKHPLAPSASVVPNLPDVILNSSMRFVGFERMKNSKIPPVSAHESAGQRDVAETGGKVRLPMGLWSRQKPQEELWSTFTCGLGSHPERHRHKKTRMNIVHPGHNLRSVKEAVNPKIGIFQKSAQDCDSLAFLLIISPMRSMSSGERRRILFSIRRPMRFAMQIWRILAVLRLNRSAASFTVKVGFSHSIVAIIMPRRIT